MTHQPLTDQPLTGSAVPMIKEETVKDDGRILIYYSFPADAAAPVQDGEPEAAHV